MSCLRGGSGCHAEPEARDECDPSRRAAPIDALPPELPCWPAMAAGRVRPGLQCERGNGDSSCTAAAALPDLVRQPAWRRVVALSAVASLILGTIGNYRYQSSDAKDFWNALYQTAQLFILHAPALRQERSLDAGGRALARADDADLRRDRLGAAHVPRGSRAASRCSGSADTWVICGLGRKGIELVRDLRAGKAPDRPGSRRHRQGPAAGSRRRVPAARSARAHRGCHAAGDAARRRACRGPSRSSRCAPRTRRTARSRSRWCARPRSARRRHRWDCFVHLNTAELGQTLQQALASRMSTGRARLHAVDAFDPEAISLLVQGLPLDHAGVKHDDARGVRLVILGFWADGPRAGGAGRAARAVRERPGGWRSR